jgi:Tfp pilus assembly protein PilF
MVPRDAWRDLRATAPPAVLDDVVKAVAAATDALQAGDDDRALELLSWAKSVAPRTATIRESLGIVLYAAGRYPEAHSELLAYRRLSGAQDQNHVLADCARAAGREDKVLEYVEQMIQAEVSSDRIAEGLIVLAGDRADHGDLEGALSTLERAGLDPVEVQPYHPRLWYVAADLSERLGRNDQAREYFEAILAVDDEFGDVHERLAALEA